MRYYVRVFGWLLLGMGTVLTAVGLLAVTGILQVQIDFFGIDLDTRADRLAWLAAWVVAAVAGLALLRVSRSRREHAPGP